MLHCLYHYYTHLSLCYNANVTPILGLFRSRVPCSGYHLLHLHPQLVFLQLSNHPTPLSYSTSIQVKNDRNRDARHLDQPEQRPSPVRAERLVEFGSCQWKARANHRTDHCVSSEGAEQCVSSESADRYIAITVGGNVPRSVDAVRVDQVVVGVDEDTTVTAPERDYKFRHISTWFAILGGVNRKANSLPAIRGQIQCTFGVHVHANINSPAANNTAPMQTTDTIASGLTFPVSGSTRCRLISFRRTGSPKIQSRLPRPIPKKARPAIPADQPRSCRKTMG